MLINIDEDNYQYGPNCNQCFDPGLTPKFFYVSVSNVLTGDLWIPGDPYPPNGTVKLSDDLACHWKFIGPNFIFRFHNHIGSTRLDIEYGPGDFAFFDAPAVQCEINFINDFAAPAFNKYYGGEASVFWIEPGQENSLVELCDNLIIPTDGLTDCLVYPLSGTQQVINMLRGVDQTKILIKRDFA